MSTPRSPQHPAERFSAPATIRRGDSLADLVGPRSVKLLAESMAAVVPAFDSRSFSRRALQGLDGLGLMQRGEHVASVLAEHLPEEFDRAAPLLIASLGPELAATEKNGLAPFFYLPHSSYIAARGVRHFDSGMRACRELTKRFTAEFCIRPFLDAHQAASLTLLATWASDSSPHVRRLVSEGTRPRLPWGKRLKAFQDDPRPTLALLELLRNDTVPYVQRSVANHLGDILKDHPDAAYATCERWLDETTSLDAAQTKARRWIIRHALRHPAKKGDARAVQLRSRAGK